MIQSRFRNRNITSCSSAGLADNHALLHCWHRQTSTLYQAAQPVEGRMVLRLNLKSNLPIRVDQNTTLVDVKYERTHSAYWYVIDKPDQFDPQETARQVQIGVCTNADNSRTMKKEGFSYEYHYRTKEGLALTDFKITTCE